MMIVQRTALPPKAISKPIPGYVFSSGVIVILDFSATGDYLIVSIIQLLAAIAIAHRFVSIDE
jgi:hypothetical protein